MNASLVKYPYVFTPKVILKNDCLVYTIDLFTNVKQILKHKILNQGAQALSLVRY